jgi:succinate dehydrogenase hydrophobic anchor subunit
MRLNLKTFNPHVIIRILSLPACIFMGCLLIKMTKTPDEFISFLRASKGAAVFSLMMIMTHATEELIVALEDYIPNKKNREKWIKILLFVGLFSVVIIGFTIWRI